MEADKLAIADCLKHPTLGIVSFQPDLSVEDTGDVIRVRDNKCHLHFIHASECEYPTREEVNAYWTDFSNNFESIKYRLGINE